MAKQFKLRWPWRSDECYECGTRHWSWRGFWVRRRLPSEELLDNSLPAIISDVRLLSVFGKEGLILTKPTTINYDRVFATGHIDALYDPDRHVILPNGLCSCGFGMETMVDCAVPESVSDIGPSLREVLNAQDPG